MAKSNIDLSRYVTGIRIQSAFLPDIYLADPFAPNQSGKGPNAFLQALKPKITVETTAIGNKSIAPYGEPGATLWPTIKIALLLSVAGVLVWKLVKR